VKFKIPKKNEVTLSISLSQILTLLKYGKQGYIFLRGKWVRWRKNSEASKAKETTKES